MDGFAFEESLDQAIRRLFGTVRLVFVELPSYALAQAQDSAAVSFRLLAVR